MPDSCTPLWLRKVHHTSERKSITQSLMSIFSKFENYNLIQLINLSTYSPIYLLLAFVFWASKLL
jgi:hypothetical protein